MHGGMTLGTVFKPVTCYGLFAEPDADRIERRRVWRDHRPVFGRPLGGASDGWGEGSAG